MTFRSHAACASSTAPQSGPDRGLPLGGDGCCVVITQRIVPAAAKIPRAFLVSVGGFLRNPLCRPASDCRNECPDLRPQTSPTKWNAAHPWATAIIFLSAYLSVHFSLFTQPKGSTADRKMEGQKDDEIMAEKSKGKKMALRLRHANFRGLNFCPGFFRPFDR